MRPILLAFFSALIVNFNFAQSTYKDYQDGVIIFQLKIDKSTDVITSESGNVNFLDIPFLNRLNNSFEIEKVTQLYPNHPNRLLERTYQINFYNPLQVDQFIKDLSAINQIEYAEKKELHITTLTPNDTYYSNSTTNGQWFLYQINAAQAWDISTGDAGTVVAVTDNAINVNHPDLTNKMLPGYDAVDNDNDPTPCGSNDGFHGSHVSGIVGAETNNNLGISSIGYDVSILPVKIGDCNGSLTGGYEGITWAADNGADVINMSWGGGGSSNYGQNVCNYAWGQGAILVAAAGNDGVNSVFYPAGYDNVVSVASTTTGDAKSNFSNYGSWIDISAPGSSILSTNQATGYQITQGTSMASPLVAGLLGLMKSHAVGASNTDIINCLYSSAANIDGANASYIGQLGAGRIDAHQAMICSNSFAYQLDAGISAVNSPIGNLCGDTYIPEITLRNYGSNTLTAATITYQVSGSASQTYNWTGSLSTGQTTAITLPSITSAPGNYTFTATTSSPNNSSDQNNSNDQSSNSFAIIPNGDQVTLSILTDCYGSEITWDITDDQNNIVTTGGGYADVTGGQLETATICLAPGCYTFNINDSYGDGLHGSQWTCTVDGNYYLEDGNGSNLFSMTAANGDFGSGTSHNFCIASSIQDDAGLTAINNPAGSNCSNNFTPEVEIQNFGSQTLTSCVINYQTTGGTLQSYNWSGTILTNQSTIVTLPNMIAANGASNFIAYTTLPNGNVDGNNLNDTASSSFTIYSNGLNLPFIEDFENGFSDQNWSISNQDGGITWDIATISGTTPGTQAAKMDFFNYGQQGQRDYLISPLLDFSNQTTIDLYFEFAYRRYDQNSTDSLVLSISTDCGQTYTRLLELGEDGTGSFATAYTNTADFTPAAGDWCMGTIGADCFNIDLSGYAGQTNVFLRFEGYNSGTTGNNLFVDNINITGDAVANCPEITTSTNDVTCFGSSDGSVSISTTNGVAPITFSLDNITFTSTSTFSGLPEGTYTAYAKGADGCIESLNFVIDQPSLVTINTLITDAACGQTNGQLTINALGGSSPYQYSINGGSTFSASSTFNNLNAGTYTVTVSDANNCTQSTTAVIDNSATNFTISTSGDQAICSGNTLTISASGVPTGGSYNWDQGIGTGASHTISPTANTTYTVTGTDANGCSTTESISVTVTQTPVVSITPTNTTICEGETTTLVANGAQTYTWNVGSAGNTLTVAPTITTTYSVIGQNGACASSSTAQIINVNALPTVVANANSTSVLVNETINFDESGSNATSYNWDFGDGSTSSLASDSHSYTSVGTYTVTLTGNLNGCTSTDIITINVDDASGLEEQHSWWANLYPNPSNGIATIQLTNTTIQTELYVFDVQGKLVIDPMIISPNENTKTIDLSNLNEGVYVLRFTNGIESFNKRMTIIR